MARAATGKVRAAAAAKPSTPKGAPRKPRKKVVVVDRRPWGLWAAGVILAALVLRLGVNALGLIPVHFDEAQYWAYGQELAWGYFSKPPLVGLVIRIATDLMGETLFALRLGSVLAHAGIAGLIYLTGRRLWDGPTGFWAAVGYTAAPGVGVSAMIMSTDPVMMLAWAGALYALVRAMEGGRWWWLVGLCLGLGTLAKYTMLVFVVGGLGYGLFASHGPRAWRGLAVAGLVALAVIAPNIWWNAANHFATVLHVAEDAAPGGGRFSLISLGEFLGAQFGVIGPVFFAALGVALWQRDGDWRLRLVLWQTMPLVLGMCALAFVTRAQPNWAAPAYVAGSLVAARVLLARGWLRALQAQLAIGATAMVSVLALAFAYAGPPGALPRALDPFKKMRIGAPFCDLALGAMAEEGAEVLLSDDRRRLSECMFLGALDWDQIAVWNPELTPRNHHELVATLRPGDPRPMLLAVHGGAAAIAARFEQAREIESGSFNTHSDRAVPYELWVVEGFRDYDTQY